MLKVFNRWYHQIFPDEEALILLLLAKIFAELPNMAASLSGGIGTIALAKYIADEQMF